MNKFLITLLSGIVIGILVAPAKGTLTRRKISNLYYDLTEDLEDEFEGTISNAEGLLADVRIGVNDPEK